MAMMVVVLDARSDIASVGATSARRLADLGVTHFAIARDATTEAVVLEGWSFDPAKSGAEAASIVAGASTSSSLHPVLEMLLMHDVEEEAAEVSTEGSDNEPVRQTT
jgi:hypothetical protein